MQKLDDDRAAAGDDAEVALIRQPFVEVKTTDASVFNRLVPVQMLAEPHPEHLMAKKAEPKRRFPKSKVKEAHRLSQAADG